MTSEMAELGRIAKDQLSTMSFDVERPECVLAAASGELFMSDSRGGITVYGSSAQARLIRSNERPAGFLPNGIALLRDRSFLIANLGSDGGVWKMSAGATLAPWLMEADGVRLPPTNFVGIDQCDRVWISVSTLQSPRWNAYHADGARDGILILVDETGARIVADGFAYTNEAKLDPAGKWLYVNETAGRRLNRFSVREDGKLGTREIVAEFGAGTFPDGLAFDVEGAVWVTSVVSNRLFRVWPEAGKVDLVFEESEPDIVAAIEAKFSAGVFPGHKPGMNGISSLAFGGPDLRTVYLGYSSGQHISSFQSPVAGVPAPHWFF